MRPGPSEWCRPDTPAGVNASDCVLGTNPGRTYRFFEGEPVVPFGYGLSYTTFKYDVVEAPTTLSLDPLRAMLDGNDGLFLGLHDVMSASTAQYAVNVTNTGPVDADDVVLGFVTPPGAGQNGVPLKTLFGFERVHVPAGSTVTVWLYPALTDFSLVGLDGERGATTGDYTVSFGVREAAEHGMGYAEAKVTAV